MGLVVKQLAGVTLVIFICCAWAEDESPDTVAVMDTVDQAGAPAVVDSAFAKPVPDEVRSEPMLDEEADSTESNMGESEPAAEVLVNKDVVLVLDNSGSMKKNDPNFLVKQAVTEFIRLQDHATRVAMVVFDQNAQLALPLTEASLDNREGILSGIDLINYKGQFTDSPAGIERALYELKINGREDARKVILFMTDGIVDTGDANRDLDKAKWLKESLATDAVDADIRVFGVAFTEAADFELIQSIAQTTDGEYYRALAAEDLQNVFEQINTIISTSPESAEPAVSDAAPDPVSTAPQAVAPVPVIIEVPDRAIAAEERIRSIIIIAAVIILVITSLAILMLLLKRSREIKGHEDTVQDAYLHDLQGKTDQQTHKLGSKPSMLGRVAGHDREHLDYIVINEPTVGRQHALIEYKDYSFWLVDQGSINGTLVNGERVETEARLKHGDRILLHKCEFEFRVPGLADSDMTVMSQTVFTEPEPAANSAQAREMHSGEDDWLNEVDDSEPEFDITEAEADESALPEDDAESALGDETVLLESTEAEAVESLSPEDDAGLNSGDETVLLGRTDAEDSQAEPEQKDAPNDVSKPD